MSTIWTPVVGVANEVIVIAEHPSLDAFERTGGSARSYMNFPAPPRSS